MNKANKGNNLAKSIGTLTIIMIASKILSLIRELAIASFYGASASTDAYFVAGGFVTNVFFGITSALSTVFLPYYINLKKVKSLEERSKEVSSIMVSLSVFSSVLIILLYVSAPLIIHLIAPSYAGQQYEESILYLRVYSLTILFSLLTNMFTSLLNAESKYGYGAIASVVYSITSITCMVFLRRVIGVTALAISVPLAFCIQLIILLVASRKYIKITYKTSLFTSSVKTLIVLMVPVLLSNATVEIDQLLTRSIATQLEKGSVSILSYSNTLFNFVTTLISSTFITVYFTEMSTAASSDDQSVFNKRVSQAINILVIILLPIAVICFIFSKDIVTIAYGRGEFDANSIKMTASCLSIYAIAFVFDGIRNLLIRAFYAKENTRIPLINSIISMLITVIGSFLLSKWIKINGIVLAICISIIITTFLLAINARTQICRIRYREIARIVIKSICSAAFSFVALVGIDRMLSKQSVYVRFGSACVVGFGVYLISLMIMKCDELKMISGLLKRNKGNRQR